MDAAAVPVRILGVPWARGLLLGWWALDSPVKVVRWLLGHRAPVNKEVLIYVQGPGREVAG